MNGIAKSIVTDPAFGDMARDNQHTILSKLDPSFAKLKPEEQQSALDNLHLVQQAPSQPPAPAPQPQAPAAVAAPQPSQSSRGPSGSASIADQLRAKGFPIPVAPSAPGSSGNIESNQSPQSPLPSIAEGFVRVTSSDGGVHDLPRNMLGKAQRRDPGLRVMQ